VPGGGEVDVTGANLEEWLHRTTQAAMHDRCAFGLAAIKAGFDEGRLQFSLPILVYREYPYRCNK
jgi:hypothetical protein